MRDWGKVNRGSIVNDRALLLEFSNDYAKHFGRLNIGCKKCIAEAFRKLINLKTNNMKTECNYLLKKKYEGVFFEGKPIRNGDLTDKLSERLLKKHPAGASLFEIIPEAKDISNTPDTDLKLSELREKYPSVTAGSKAKFLAKVAEVAEAQEVVQEVVQDEEE